LTAWQVLPEDWDHHQQYDQWLLAYEETFERTETEWGSWTIVEATNRRYTNVKIFNTIIESLQRQLALMDALPDPAYWESSSEEDEKNFEAEDETDEESLLAENDQ
jgi:hypothetical protein